MTSRIALAAAAVLFGAGAALASETPGEAEALTVQEEVVVQETVTVNNEQSSQQSISSDAEGQANNEQSGPETTQAAESSKEPSQQVIYSAPVSTETSPPPAASEQKASASIGNQEQKPVTLAEYYFAASASSDLNNPPVLTNTYPASEPVPAPTQPLEGFLYQLQQLLGSAFAPVTMLPEIGFSNAIPFQPELTLLLIVTTAISATSRYVASLKRSGFVGAPRSDMLPLTSITPLKWVLSGRFTT